MENNIVVVDNFRNYLNIKEEAPIHIDLKGKALSPGIFTRLLYQHFRSEYPEHPTLAMDSKTWRRTIYLDNIRSAAFSPEGLVLLGNEITNIAKGMPWRVILKLEEK